MRTFTRVVNMSPGLRDTGDEIDAEHINVLQESVEDLQTGALPIALAGIEGALGAAGVRHLGSGRANVLDYNDHAGDGSTSINSLVAEMVADTTTDDVLEFPSGGYLLTAQWVLAAPRKVVLHPGAVLVLADGVNNHAVRINAPGCYILGGTLDANGANQTYDGNGVFVGHRDAVGCVIDGLTIINPKYMGIRSQAARTRIRNVTVDNSGYIGIFIKTDGTYNVADQFDSEVLFCTVDRSALDPSTLAGGGIQIYGEMGSGLKTVGTKVIGNTVRLPLNPTSPDCQPIETHSLGPKTLISGNHTYGGSMGISCNQSDGSVVSGNVVTDAGVYGIECADTNTMSIVGNTIAGSNGVQGISASSVSDTESMLSVMGNVISRFDTGVHIQKHRSTIVGGNAIETPSGGAGVKFQQSEYSSIFGNVMKGSGSGSKGLWLDRSSHLSAMGNDIDGYYDAIQLLGSDGYTFEDSIVGPNLLRNFTNRVTQYLSGGSAVAASFVMRDVVPTITGSAGSNAALADLLTQLDALGYIVDGTS